MSDALASERKGDVHRRLLDAYAALGSKDERRDFVERLAVAAGRSEQSVKRWVGAHAKVNGPPSTVLEKVEGFLKGEEK